MNYNIKNIKWDRIWIYFETDRLPMDKTIYLRSIDGSFSAPLKKCNSDEFLVTNGLNNNPDNSSWYKINITNPGNCEMLPVGIYNLFVESRTSGSKASSKIYTDQKKGTILSTSIKYMRSLNRKFVYFHSERAYIVQFSSKNGLSIKTSDIHIPGLGLKQNTLSFIRTSRHKLAKAILRFIYDHEYYAFHRDLQFIIYESRFLNKDKQKNISLPEIQRRKARIIQRKKNPNILLMSDQSEEMGSNMLALKKALIQKGYKPKEALRAITTKHYSIFHWIKTLKKIAEADFIFLDDHSQTTDWLTIKGAVITQLWHAGAGFKSTGYSRFGMPASPAPKSGHRQYTYGIAGSKKIRHFFSEVWGINDEMVLPTGMPRLDEYLDVKYRKEKTAELLIKYPILCKQTHTILFAPTYRGENKRHAYYPYDKLDMDKLYELCKLTNSIIIFKMHPFVTEPVPIPEEYKDRMMDISEYPNINDLFYVTDLLITDYSSNIYEYSLMKKPMLFYAFDIDTYTKERGFHRDYRTNVPGKIAETFDEMYDAIKNNDFDYYKVEEYIANNFEYTDSHACDRIIDWIIRGKRRQPD